MTDDPLRDLEILARDNSIYAWKAFVEDVPAGAPLPTWLETYLREFGRQLLDLAERDQAMPPGVVTDRTKVLLGLSDDTPGRGNKVSEYRENSRNAKVAVLREHGHQPGQRPVRLKVIMKAYGASKSAVRDWIERAHALWQDQAK